MTRSRARHWDALFHRSERVVASPKPCSLTCAKATQGEKTVFNCHRFSTARVVRANRSDIRASKSWGPALVELVDQRLRRFVMGENRQRGSILLFLSELGRVAGVGRARAVACHRRASHHREARARTMRRPPRRRRRAFTLMALMAKSLVATTARKQLYFSTYKRVAQIADTARAYRWPAKRPASGIVNHFIVSASRSKAKRVARPRARRIVGVAAACNLQVHLDRRRCPSPNAREATAGAAGGGYEPWAAHRAAPSRGQSSHRASPLCRGPGPFATSPVLSSEGAAGWGGRPRRTRAGARRAWTRCAAGAALRRRRGTKIPRLRQSRHSRTLGL